MKIDSEKLLITLDDRRHEWEIASLFGGRRTRREAELAKDEIALLVKIIKRAEEVEAERERKNLMIEMDLFDESEVYTDCTVQLLHNTVTDEYSVGWFENKKRG